MSVPAVERREWAAEQQKLVRAMGERHHNSPSFGSLWPILLLLYCSVLFWCYCFVHSPDLLITSALGALERNDTWCFRDRLLRLYTHLGISTVFCSVSITFEVCCLDCIWHTRKNWQPFACGLSRVESALLVYPIAILCASSFLLPVLSVVCIIVFPLYKFFLSPDPDFSLEAALGYSLSFAFFGGGYLFFPP